MTKPCLILVGLGLVGLLSSCDQELNVRELPYSFVCTDDSQCLDGYQCQLSTQSEDKANGIKICTPAGTGADTSTSDVGADTATFECSPQCETGYWCSGPSQAECFTNCGEAPEDDAKCAADHHCFDDFCVPDIEAGKGCNEDSDCVSSVCTTGGKCCEHPGLCCDGFPECSSLFNEFDEAARCDSAARTCAFIGVVPIPTTGQTECFNTSSSDECRLVVDSFPKQDGGVEAGVPRKYEVDSRGEAGSEEVMVKDLATGLLWVQDSEPTDSTTEAREHCMALNVARFADNTGWMVPSRHQLQTLLDYSVSGRIMLDCAFSDKGVVDPCPTDAQFVTPTSTLATEGGYWTSTIVAGSGQNEAWRINFTNGNIVPLPITNTNNPPHVRCVKKLVDIQ